MMSGDFTQDPLGGTRGVTLYTGQVLFPNLVNPYSGTPFQCDAGTGNPLPAPGGIQAAGVNCNKIPGPSSGGSVFDPAGAQLIQLYPGSNTSNVNGGFNFTNVPVRKLNEGEFDIRLDHNFSGKDSIFARFSYDQAYSLVPGGSNPTGPTGFAEATPFGSTQNITNHGRNVAISETHIFSSNTVNQINGGFNRIFNFIKSYGYGTCESNNINNSGVGIPNANVDSTCGGPAGLVNQSSQLLHELRTGLHPAAGWGLLVSGRPRVRAFPGWNQRLCHLRFV